MITDPIEIRARDLFHAHRAEVMQKRGDEAASAMMFEGSARDRYMTWAAELIAKEPAVTAADRWYADQLAEMTDADIEYRIGKIDEEVAFLPYRPLTVNIADRGAGLADERRRLVTEQLRRSVEAGMKVAAE